MGVKFNYAYLRGFIKEVYKTNKDYADFLGIGVTTLYEKLNNKTPFTQREIFKTVEANKLNADDINRLFFNQ